jgi:WD40 repeat protein
MPHIDFAFPGLTDDRVITGNRIGQFMEWEPPNQSQDAIFSVISESVTAAAFDENYGVLVCATTDRFLRFFSYRKRECLRSIEMDTLAEQLIITDGWGFVLVYLPRVLMLFTLNGFLIKKCSIDFEISFWTTWMDASGFDYIGVADSVGNVFVFEAFYPEEVKQFASLHKKIVRMEYSYVARAVVTVASSPYVYLIPVK